MPPLMCKVCGTRPAISRAGFCVKCKPDKAKHREQHERRKENDKKKAELKRQQNKEEAERRRRKYDKTMEELDKLVEEQYRNLPDWWPDEIPFGEGDELDGQRP